MAALYLLDLHGIGTLIETSEEGVPLGIILVPIGTLALIGFVTGPVVARHASTHD